MRRYLVVAHKTLGGEHLMDEVRARQSAGPCAFHLVVPITHPHGSWTDGQAERQAHEVLDHGLVLFKELGVEVTGEVGDANPVYAVGTVLRREPGAYDEVLLSTLPAGPSRWLKWDVPSRIARVARIPVTHLVAEREPVG